MKECSISTYGAVPIVEEGKELLSLTGSATVINIGGRRYLIDLGAFQGGELADTFNKEHIEFLNNLDAVIITHSHLDHVGRLPLLYKAGFSGKIYMTRLTKLIAKEILLDSLRIQEDKFNEHKNKKIIENIKTCFQVKQKLLAIRSGSLKEDTVKYKKYLRKVLGEDYDKEKVLRDIQDYLTGFGLEETEKFQFEEVQEIVSQKLFSETDIYEVLELIEEIDYDVEKKIAHSNINYKNRNIPHIDILENLPANLDTHHTFELSRSEKRKVVQLWKDQLTNEKIYLRNNPNKKVSEKIELKEMLEKIFRDVENFNSIIKGGVKLSKSQKGEHELGQKILEEYGIVKRKDITNAMNTYGKILPYTSNDIEKAKELLKDKDGKPQRENITLNFSKSAHVPGGAIVTLSSQDTRYVMDDTASSVRSILEETAVTFTGDMGKIENNRLGKPALPPKAVDYITLESTYGDRNDISRDEAKQGLLESILGRKGRCLISVFAQQRLSEILLTLFELIYEEKLGKNTQIFIDSELGKKINDIYMRELPEVYGLLKTEAQIRFLGRVVFKFLNPEELEYMYQKPGKEIILASSGMIAGGRIMSHLQYILPDKKNKIITSGYLAQGTIGNTLIHPEDIDTITIDDKTIKVLAQRIGLSGFSAHIGQTDLLNYIDECLEKKLLKENATISLVHGNREAQEILKQLLEEVLQQHNRKDISIIIPELGSEYNIHTKEFEETQEKVHNCKVIKKKKTPIRPSFLGID